jgi:trehalose-phosphatase
MRAPTGVPSVAYWSGLVGRLTAARRAGRTLLLLSDYDGTLTPIVRDPAEAWLPPAVREDLRTLAASERIIVGIVSGRPLDDLRRRIGLSSILYAGCHGLEVAGLDLAFEHHHAHAQRPSVAALARELTRRASAFAGVLVEAKGLSVAVHYRNASPVVFNPLLDLVREQVRAHPGYAVVPGRKVLEILPAADWDKGRCVRWIESQIEQRTGEPVTPIYLGDDVTDERVFVALHGRGITVRVGEATATRATYRLPSVDDVYRVLSALADHAAGGVSR